MMPKMNEQHFCYLCCFLLSTLHVMFMTFWHKISARGQACMPAYEETMCPVGGNCASITMIWVTRVAEPGFQNKPFSSLNAGRAEALSQAYG